MEVSRRLHFKETVSERNHRAHESIPNAVCLSVLDDLHYGVVVVKAALEIVWMNNTGRVLLQQKDGLHVEHNHLVASHAQVMRELQKLLTRGDIKEGYRCLKVPRHSLRRPLELVVSHIRIPEAKPEPQPGCWTLLIFDPERTINASADFIAQMYGLTASEGEVARLLMEGKTLHQLSTLLGKRKETARKQLQSIFEKTNTKRQSDLIRLLLSGPAALH